MRPTSVAAPNGFLCGTGQFVYPERTLLPEPTTCLGKPSRGALLRNGRCAPTHDLIPAGHQHDATEAPAIPAGAVGWPIWATAGHVRLEFPGRTALPHPLCPPYREIPAYATRDSIVTTQLGTLGASLGRGNFSLGKR
eukprot:947161-Amphidinium_carterae.2